MRCVFWLAGASGLLLSAAALAQATRPAVALTIYASSGQTPGYALIRQRRTLEVAAGENRLELPDVPNSLDPASVVLTSTAGPRITLLEQSLLSPPTSPDQLLAHCLGQEVLVNRRQQGNDERARHPETINARLLGFDERWLVLGTSNRQLPVEIIPRSSDITEIKLMGEGAPPIHTALACRVLADADGTAQVQMDGRAAGLSWRSNYTLSLTSAHSATLSCMVTLENRSGIPYAAAAIQLAHEEGNAQRIFSLQGPIDLPDHSSRQIALIPAIAGGLEVTRLPIFRTPRDASSTQRIDEFLCIENSRHNGLGRALPPGAVRVLDAQGPGAPLDLGERPVGSIRSDEPLRVRLGSARGLFAQTLDRGTHESVADGLPRIARSREVRLINRRTEPVRILVVQRADPDDELLDPSDPAQRPAAGEIHFLVDVPAKSEKRITYSLRSIAAE